MSGIEDEHEGRSTAGLSVDQQQAPRSVVIEVLEASGTARRADLSSGMLVVGSASRGCDLRIDDAAVSRRHLSLQLVQAGVKVTDLGSRNGTRYLGARIHEVVVPVGGAIQLGKSTLRFSQAGPAPELSEREELQGMLGRSMPMRRLFAAIERLAPTDSTVVIHGETGTGKELAARTLHALSPRARGPFEVVELGGISSELIESNLFGHARGAFTGATSAAQGAIARAEGGTLLFTGVGELPLELQPKLLRFLEAREYQPVGGARPMPASVRVIAKTSRSLDLEVKAGRLRSDLMYRLAVITLEVPPLRERAEDIAVLAAHFARKVGGVDVELEASTVAALQCDLWPGNVRELKNAVERAVLLGDRGTDEPANGPDSKPGFKEARAQLLERFERDYLIALMAKMRGNVSAAARRAGLSRAGLYNLLKRHQLDPPESP